MMAPGIEADTGSLPIQPSPSQKATKSRKSSMKSSVEQNEAERARTLDNKNQVTRESQGKGKASRVKSMKQTEMTSKTQQGEKETFKLPTDSDDRKKSSVKPSGDGTNYENEEFDDDEQDEYDP